MGTPLHALLVEDSESDASLIVRQLTKAGYEVDWERVETAGEMRAELEKRDWDVIIADYQLPAFDARAALAILKQTGLDLPFLVVSGHIGEETAAALMKAGAQDFVMKQNLARLAPAVERELRDAGARRKSVKAATQLRETQHLLERILDTTPDLIYIYDIVEGRNRYVNLALAEFLGYDAGRIQGIGSRLFQEILHPEDTDLVARHHARFSAVGDHETLECEYRVRRSDGQWRRMHSRDVLFARNERGEPQSLLGVAQDITERKQAQERLSASQELVHSLIENTVDHVYVKDRAGRYLLANSAVARDSGKPVEDLLGKDDTALFPRADAAVIMEFDRKVMAHRAIEMVEDELTTATGERRLYLSTKGPMFGPDGEITGLFGISRDITDHRRAEEDKRQLEAQLLQAQKLESIGRLAGGIAHDFNNLLTVINGYTDLALQGLNRSDPLHHMVSEVRKAGEQAAALTAQLLAFSRQRAIAPKLIDCNELLAANQDMFQRLVGEDVQVIVKPALSPVCVTADPGQLVQVLMNLVVNARDAMPRGGTLTMDAAGIEPDAATTAAHPGIAPGPYVLLTVTDTGEGIDQETQEHIFDPFFTSKPVGKGTGLGLSTAYGIVRQGGGFIQVDSEPGRGAKFMIYLPRTEGAPVEPPATGPGVATARGFETVLVVEDQPNVRELAREILRRGGYGVLEAANGGEALLICERHPGPIHLVLTDVVMPGMDGPGLARRIESLKPGTKVLFMSGYTGGAPVNLGAPGVSVAYLQKPFTPETLTRKVSEILAAPLALQGILVADDAAQIRRIFSLILTNAGYSVVEAADGAETRERLRSGGIALALIDLNMPSLEGLEDIRKLRSEYPGVKIVLMSAAFGPTSSTDSRALGVDAVLGKPARPEVLLDAVRRLLAPHPGGSHPRKSARLPGA